MAHTESERHWDRFSSSDGLTEEQVAWLDSRMAVRTAWMVQALQGSLPPQAGLANNIRELRSSSKHGLRSGNFIRTHDDLWNWVGNESESPKHPLRQLSSGLLEKFIAEVEFRDYVKDGQRYQHVGGFYYGDLLREHEMGYRELFEVYALFNVSAEYGVESYGWRRCGNISVCQCCHYAHYTCVC